MAILDHQKHQKLGQHLDAVHVLAAAAPLSTASAMPLSANNPAHETANGGEHNDNMRNNATPA